MRGERCALFPGLSSVPIPCWCLEPSLSRPAFPEPSGTERSQAGEAPAGDWTLELVGGGEQRRGAKLSNCVQSGERGAGGGGGGGFHLGGGGGGGGGQEPRGSERARRD
jgi:hypothetical protein